MLSYHSWNHAYLNALREASTFLLQHLRIQRVLCMIIYIQLLNAASMPRSKSCVRAVMPMQLTCT